MSTEVTAIDLQGGEAIKLYSTLLKAYPQYPRNDQVLYQLARAYETTGQPEQALSTLDTHRHPLSADARSSTKCSSVAASSCSPPSSTAKRRTPTTSSSQRNGNSSLLRTEPLQTRLGLFKQGQSEDALPSFAGVLDQKLVGKSGGSVAKKPESLKRADRELVEDTLRVMAITFSYLEGSETVDGFLNKRGKATPYANLVYSRLGDLYVEKERYPGRRDDLSRLRSARPEQRIRTEPRDAGHRGLQQGRASPSSCSKANTSTSSAITSAPLSGPAATARNIRRS